MANTSIPYKTYLTEQEMPRYWYNVKTHMKNKHAPFLNSATGKPCTKDDLRSVFCDECIEQEFNDRDEYVAIPQGILDFYKMFRPSPLVRAYFLERFLDTPAEIYYKLEGNNTSGSHKLNSAAAQAYYAKQQGITRLTTETGAGQWGTALSMACAFYGLQLCVYMVKASAEQKPHRREVMRTFGAEVMSSPGNTTSAGRAILARFPDTGGSLGCAISEAVETALSTQNCRYVLGSVLDHVLLHQSVIGTECKIALDKYGIVPDVVIGCMGGGSNFGGLIAPFMGERLQGKNEIRFVGVEPRGCPTLTRGKFAYDYCDAAKMTPLAKMYTLGCGFMPSPNHAGGLRYHGMSPVLSQLYHDGYIEAVAVGQKSVFEAATDFAKCEGILPAPESAHAIRAATDEALECKRSGKKKVILFGLTGTGYFDLSAYKQYNDGTMTDEAPTDEMLIKGFASIPDIR